MPGLPGFLGRAAGRYSVATCLRGAGEISE